jgi:HSP20 family protein
MMRAKIYPTKNFYQRPMFWGIERDLKDVLDSVESVWSGTDPQVSQTQLKETEQGYFLSVDVPGFNKTNLDMQLEGERLVLKGKRKLSLGGEEEQMIAKSFLLPNDVDGDKIQAHCEDGVLYLALPKLEKSQPKRIDVHDGEHKLPSWTGT